jgi:hypothetical protein
MPGRCKGPRHNSGRHAQSALCGRGKLLEPIMGRANRSSALWIKRSKWDRNKRAVVRTWRSLLSFEVPARRAARRPLAHGTAVHQTV